MTNDLKPCPFCGGIAHITKSYDPDGFGAFHHVQCSKCRAKGTEFHAMETCPIFFEQVRAAWNTRAKTKAADALEADLCAVVKPLEWDDHEGSNAASAFDHIFGGLVVKHVSEIEEYERYRSARLSKHITIRSASDVAAEARAGAIEAAASRYMNGAGPESWDFFKEAFESIRALHDADTTAAIERIKEQARQEERERLTDIIRMYPKPHSNRIIESIMDDE